MIGEKSGRAWKLNSVVLRKAQFAFRIAGGRAVAREYLNAAAERSVYVGDYGDPSRPFQRFNDTASNMQFWVRNGVVIAVVDRTGIPEHVMAHRRVQPPQIGYTIRAQGAK